MAPPLPQSGEAAMAMTDDRRISDIGERGWLAILRERFAAGSRSYQIGGGGSRTPLIVPIGDDAAVRRIQTPFCEILTSDVMVEGTHFKKEWLNWPGLARRAVLAAASDIAAMGGEPEGFLLSLGLPSDTRLSDLEDFADALKTLCDETGLMPYGGDTARSDRIFVDVTVLGRAPRNRILLQSGGQVGDALWVTGALGAARAAWSALDDPQEGEEGLRERFWTPPIRWPLLDSLRNALPIRALTDLSDGLAVDLEKILRDTECGASVRMEAIPVDPMAEKFCRVRGIDPFDFAFLGGEDFELLVVEAGDSRGTVSIPLGSLSLRRFGTLTDRQGSIERWRGNVREDAPLQPFEHFG